LSLFKKIGSLLQNKVWQKLFENFLSLSVLQGLSSLAELITLPYLTTTLGAVYYGLISFAISFMAFFQIITEYGFDYSGTRAISKYRDEPKKIQSIYSAINLVKIIISSLCFVLIIIIIFVFEKFRQNSIIFLLLFGLIIQSILFPIWFFRGIEKMKYITIIDFIGKVFLIIAIFSFINSEVDYVLYPFFILLNAIFIGLIAQIFIFKKYRIKLNKSSFSDIKFQFSSGFFMFLVYFSSNIITNLNPFILGLLVDYKYVGIFMAGYKVIQIFVTIISLITITVFPHIVKVVSARNNKVESNVFKFIRKVLIIIIVIGLLSFAFLFIFADFTVNFLFDIEYRDTINVIRILSIAPLLIGIGHTLTLQIMVPLEFDSQVAKIYGFSAILNIILCFVFIPIFGFLALCYIILIIRIIPIVLSVIWISRNKDKLNQTNSINNENGR